MSRHNGKLNLPGYIDLVGLNVLAQRLNVAEETVRTWRNLEYAPRPQTAFELIDMAAGVLSWESIYQPFFENQNKTAKTA